MSPGLRCSEHPSFPFPFFFLELKPDTGPAGGGEGVAGGFPGPFQAPTSPRCIPCEGWGSGGLGGRDTGGAGGGGLCSW